VVCEALKEPFRNHTALCCELIDWVCERQIPGDFAMDSYFTCAEILNHIHGKQDHFGQPRGYVGDLKTNRKLEAPTPSGAPAKSRLGGIGHLHLLCATK